MPTVDASTNKLTEPKHLHLSNLGPLLLIEPIDGPKVGVNEDNNK